MLGRWVGTGVVLGGVVAALVSSSAPRSAHAQSPPRPPSKLDPKTAEAKRLFDEGADHYTQGDYEEAVVVWEKAYELSRRALILESIANAYERLGQAKKARENLARWRAEAPADEHDVLDARLKKLDERIAHEDEIEARRRTQTQEIPARGTDPAPGPESSLTGSAVAGSSLTSSAVAGSSARPIEATPAPRSSPPILGYTLGGVGLAAVGIGITLDFLAVTRRPDPSAVCFDASGQRLCRVSARDDIESSNTLAIAGDTAWIAGSVMLAAGLGLVLGSAFKSSTARVMPSAGRRAAGLGLAMEF